MDVSSTADTATLSTIRIEHNIRESSFWAFLMQLSLGDPLNRQVRCKQCSGWYGGPQWKMVGRGESVDPMFDICCLLSPHIFLPKQLHTQYVSHLLPSHLQFTLKMLIMKDWILLFEYLGLHKRGASMSYHISRLLLNKTNWGNYPFLDTKSKHPWLLLSWWYCVPQKHNSWNLQGEDLMGCEPLRGDWVISSGTLMMVCTLIKDTQELGFVHEMFPTGPCV